jgi:hypothetical protein
MGKAQVFFMAVIVLLVLCKLDYMVITNCQEDKNKQNDKKLIYSILTYNTNIFSSSRKQQNRQKWFKARSLD